MVPFFIIPNWGKVVIRAKIIGRSKEVSVSWNKKLRPEGTFEGHVG